MGERDRSKDHRAYALLTAAGAVDALIFLHAKEQLAVYMTGNTTKLGQSLVRLDGGAAPPLLIVIASFVCATIAAAWLGTRAGRARAACTLAAVSLLLALAQVWSGPRYSLFTIALIAAAMGALNQVLPDEQGGTFVTGTIVRLARALASHDTRKARGLALRWVAFLGGAVLATAADERFGAPVLGGVAAATAIAAVVSARRPARDSSLPADAS